MTRRRIAALCWLVGALNAVAWGLITPPFHVPDEISHYSYAQVLIEKGELPRHQPGGGVAPDVANDLSALRFFETIGNQDDKPIDTPAEQAVLRANEAAKPPAYGAGDALTASAQPPLYYAVEGVAYAASPWHDVLDRLQLMRILSGLLTGLTALFAALFVAELLPRAPWAYAAAGLVVAFQPVAGFIGGGVNGDAALYVTSAALFYAVARVLCRGLDLRNAVILGVALLAGLLSKLTFEALVPMAVIALGAAVWRERRGPERAQLLRAASVALAIGILPFVVYHFAADSLRVAATAAADGGGGGNPAHRSLAELLSYTWQLYLPRLPFMTDLIPQTPLYNTWFVGLVGRFGWVDYSFPPMVSRVAVVPALLVLAGAAVTLWRARRHMLTQIAVYASGVIVLLGAIAYQGYDYLKDTGERFEQARYLLPLLALYGLLVALALRALGPRWGRVAAAAVVVFAAGHSLFAQLLTLGRYYG